MNNTEDRRQSNDSTARGNTNEITENVPTNGTSSSISNSGGSFLSMISSGWTFIRLWCAGSGMKSNYLNHDENLAQRMFWCGCFGLPWLWFVNILYFRTRVYGPIPYVDTTMIGVKSQNQSNDEQTNSSVAYHNESSNSQTSQQQQQQQQQFEMSEHNVVRNEDFNPNANNDTDYQDNNNNSNVHHDPMKEAELIKWVKRSSIGCMIVSMMFILWNIFFQLNRNKFNKGWLVLSIDDQDATGW